MRLKPALIRCLLALSAAAILCPASQPAAAAPQEETFNFGISDAKQFYKGYDEARALTAEEKYDAAIRKYEEILAFADSKTEQAMVYEDLSNIYKEIGNAEKELFFVQRAVDTTMDKKNRDNLTSRMRILRRQAGASATIQTTPLH